MGRRDSVKTQTGGAEGCSEVEGGDSVLSAAVRRGMGDEEGTAWPHADPVFTSPHRRQDDAREVPAEYVVEEVIGSGAGDEGGEAPRQQSSRGQGDNGEGGSDDEVDAHWEQEVVEPPDRDASNRAAETIARAEGAEEGDSGDSSPETLVVVLIDRRDKGVLPPEMVSSSAQDLDGSLGFHWLVVAR